MGSHSGLAFNIIGSISDLFRCAMNRVLGSQQDIVGFLGHIMGELANCILRSIAHVSATIDGPIEPILIGGDD